MSAVIRTPERVGSPLHLVDRDGAIARSFADDGEVYRRDIPYSGLRIIAAAHDGSIWAARRGRYQLVQWDTLGAKLKVIVAMSTGLGPTLGTLVPPRPRIAPIDRRRCGRPSGSPLGCHHRAR